jgi:hypothetical protein
MPMAATRKGRLRQVRNWLADKFPTPYPVTLRIGPIPREPDSDGDRPARSCGDTTRTKRRITIRISDKLDWYSAIDTLLHEWAHARSYPHSTMEDKLEHHGSQWAVTYGEIYMAYHDKRGWDESRKYQET